MGEIVLHWDSTYTRIAFVKPMAGTILIRGSETWHLVARGGLASVYGYRHALAFGRYPCIVKSGQQAYEL